ncbi:MAG: hypothetical protein ACOX4G_03185 [Limnochordia bacterium]
MSSSITGGRPGDEAGSGQGKMAIERNIVISRRLQPEAGRPLAHHGPAVVTTCAEGTGRGHRGTRFNERQREVAETPTVKGER